MNARVADLVRVVIALGLLGCLYGNLMLAWTGFEASTATGAGAAQGDLGRYMLLKLVTPWALAFFICALALELALFRAVPIQNRLVGPIALLAYFGIVGLGWNWFYLHYLWR